jgi:hypothetical protein
VKIQIVIRILEGEVQGNQKEKKRQLSLNSTKLELNLVGCEEFGFFITIGIENWVGCHEGPKFFATKGFFCFFF